MPEYHKDIFEASYARCTRSPRFIRTFYDSFITNGPDGVREKFSKMNFAKQRISLERAVSVAAAAVSGDRKALQQLEERAYIQRKSGINITAPLYRAWFTTILAAAEKHDPQFNSKVAEAWESVMNFLIQRMLRDYES